jgi:hypothetical protein
MNVPKYTTLLDIAIPNKPTTNEQRLHTKGYLKWRAMLRRCTCKLWLAKHPTYLGCSVCESWLTFSNFYTWLEKTPNFQDLSLDKDILVPGNKVYSPDTCCLITQHVNTLLTSCTSSRGDYPVGVTYSKRENKYRAVLSTFGASKHIGTFKTPEEASDAYLTAKKEHILEVALTQDTRVATALVTYAKALI